MSSRASSASRERGGETQHDRGAPAGLLDLGLRRRSRACPARRRATQLEPRGSAARGLEEVLPLAGIEEVRHHRGVVGERADVDAEPVHQLLRPVRDERRAARRDERRRARRAPSASSRSVAVDVRDVARRSRPRCRAAGCVTGAPSQHRLDRVTGAGVGRAAAAARPRRRASRARLDVDVERRRRSATSAACSPERVEQARQQGAERELVEQHADLLRGPTRPGAGRRGRRRAARRGAATTSAGSGTPAPRASPRFWRCFGGSSSRCSKIPSSVAVRGHELGRRLLADARARRAGCRSGRRGAPRTRGTARR